MYWDDRYGTETVSHEVLGRMKQLMVDNNTAASHSFLLDDDSSIPFSLDDISNLMEDKVSTMQHIICSLQHSNGPCYCSASITLPLLCKSACAQAVAEQPSQHGPCTICRQTLLAQPLAFSHSLLT